MPLLRLSKGIFDSLKLYSLWNKPYEMLKYKGQLSQHFAALCQFAAATNRSTILVAIWLITASIDSGGIVRDEECYGLQEYIDHLG
jgi:hypothetical protein